MNRRHGGVVVDEIKQLGIKVIRVPAGQAAEAVARAFAGESDVAYAEPNAKTTAVELPNDPSFGLQWGLTNVDAADAWTVSKSSASTLVAVVDTGVSQSHSDLAGKIALNVNFSDSSTVDDTNGHGTHVAGIAAASTNNALGIAGLGWNARIENVKALGDNGSGFYSWMIQGITWAADHGAQVINISAGGTSDSQSLQDAVDYAWSKGSVVVAAAGNNGSSAPFYPAYYTNAIAVAATDSVDHLASFSDYGSWVDVAAPGVTIYSTLPGDTYGYKSGTSMASPLVAGEAALLASELHDTNGDGRVNDEVRAAIERTTDPCCGGNIANGRINAYKAVEVADHLAFSMQPSSATAGSAFLTQPIVVVKDPSGNTVTTGPDASANITINLQSGGGTLQGTTTVAAVNGVAVFANLRLDNAADAKTLRATKADTSSSGGSGTIAVDSNSFRVGPALADHLTFTSSTGSLASGASRNLTVEVRDAFGNVETADSTTSVTFAKTAGTGTVTALGSATVSGGVASQTVTGALAGSITITASGASLTNGTTTFTIGAGAANRLALTSSTTNLASGSSRTLTAELRDATGNLVSGDNTTVVTFAKASGNGTVTGLGTATASGGVASTTVTGALAGSITITASATSVTSDTTTFSVTVGAADHLTFTSSTGDLISGNARALTVEVRDAGGNLVASDNTTSVTFARTAGAGTVTGLGTATAAGGVATETVSAVLAGSITITASAPSLNDATATFTIDPGAADHLTFTSSTAGLAAGTSRALTVEVRDTAGNLEIGDNSTSVTFARTAGVGTVTGLATSTASGGVASQTVTGALAGSITITATAASLTSGSTTFTVVAGAADHLALTSSTANLRSGTTRTVTAEVRDAGGNLVASDNTTTVTFAKTGGAGTVTGLGTATASAGVASQTVAGALAGSITITATASSLTSDSTTFTVVPGAADHLTFTSSTADVASGNTRTLTVDIRDAGGNLVTSDNTTAVTFAKTSGPGTVTGLGSATASAGVASKTVTGALAGQIAIGASATSVTSDATTFTIGAGPADHLSFTISVAGIASGTARALTVEVCDAAGNLETGDNTTLVTFAKTGGAGTITGLGTATASAGVASRTVSGAHAGSITIIATATLLTSDSTTFTVVSGVADHLTFSSSAGDLASGATRTLTVEIRDSGGNLVTSDNITAITFAKTSGVGSVTGLGTATASAGVASQTVAGALAGSITITATASSLTSDSTTFTVVPGAADHLTFTSSTADVASGNTRTLTVEIRDAGGNLVTSDNTTAVTFAKTSGPGTVTGLGTAIAATGLATKTVTGALAGSITINASATSLTSDSTTFTVLSGVADHLAFSSSTGDLASGKTRTLTVEIRDAGGNLVAGDNSTLVTFAKASGSGTVTGLGTAIAAAGVATKTVTGALSGSITITAAAGTLTSDSTTLLVVPGAADRLVFTSSTADLAAGATRTLAVEVRDAAGNIETGDNTTSVTFAKTVGAAGVTGLGSVTASSGVATKTVTGTVAGSIAIAATSNTLTSDSTTFAVVAGAADRLTFTSSTGDLVSGNTRTLTVEIRDSAGNLETGDNSTVVTFAKTSGSGTVTGLGTVTASGGVARQSVTGVLAGTVTITASAASLTSDSTTFRIDPGAAAQLAFTSSTGDVASGSSRALTVEIRDAAGNLETGDDTTSVTFAKAAGAGTVTGLGSAAAFGGVARITVTGGLAGSITIGASATSVTSDATTLAVVAGAADHLVFTSSTGDLGAGTTRTLAVEIRDAGGNLVTNDNSTSVTFAKTSGAGTVGGLGTVTAAGGVVSTSITGTLAGPITITASTTSLTSGTTTFTIVAGAADHLVLSSSAVDLRSGTARTLTAEIRDVGGNLVTSDNSTSVTFAKISGAGAVTGLGAATASGGIASKDVTGAIAGSLTITASAASLTSASTTFGVVPGAANLLIFTSSTANLAAGSTRTLTVEIRDAGGNLETADNATPVTFAKTSGTGTVTGLGTATASGGVATKTVTGAVAGSITITASAASLTSDSTTLGLVAGAADHLTFTSSTGDLVSGSMRTLSIEIRDASGNLVTGDNSTAVTVAKTSGLGTVTGLGTATPSGGVASETVTGARAGSVTITASAASLTGDTTTFTIDPGSSDHLTFTNSTASLASGTSRALTVEIRDAAGNLEKGDNTTAVTFVKTSGAGTVTGLGTVTALGGVASPTAVGMLAGSVTITASAASLTGDTTTFTINPGAADHLAFTSSTGDLAAGATRVLTAEVRDAAGNLETGDNTTSVTFAKTNGAGTVSSLATATASGGVATKTVTGALAGSITITATATSLSSDSTTFTVVPGAAARLTFTSSAANLSSGATRTLTAEVRDAGGNVVTSDSTTVVTFAKTDGAGTVTGLGSATASGGVAAQTVTGALAGSLTITASASSLTAATTTFTIVPGAADHITFTSSTADLTAGSTRTLTVEIRDARGNLETGDSTTVVTFAKVNGAGTVTGLGNATTSGGIAYKNVTGSLAGSITVSASATALGSGSTTFGIVAGAADHLTFTSSTTSLASGTSRALTVEVRDGAGNLETGDNTTVVTFAKADGAGTVNGLGNATASGGVASQTVTGALAGSITITASATSLNSGSTTFNVVAGTADHLTFTSANVPLISGSARMLTVQIRDAAGNLVASDNTTNVTFAKTTGAGTVTGLGSATASGGIASNQATGALAGSITITATSSSLSSDATTFAIVPGAADHLTFTSSNTELAAGATRTLTAEVRDAAGNLEIGDNATVVTFAKTGGTGTVNGLGTATASNGVAYKNVNGQIAGSITISASATSLTSDTTTFSVVAGAADHLTFTNSTTSLASGTSRTLTVEIRDFGGNLVTSDNTTRVTFAKTSGAGTAAGLGNATASGGVATRDVTGVLAGSITITASAGSLTDAATTFTVVPSAPDHITFTSPTADLAAGSTRTLTAEVRDAAGNLETGDNATSVTFAKTSGAGTVTGLGKATASGGVASQAVIGALAGSVTITATATSLNSDATTFTVVPGAADHLSFTSSTADLASGNTRTLTVAVRDAAGNLESGDNTTVVTFAKTSGTGTVTGLGTTTAAGGIATKTVTGTLAGPLTITAGAGSLGADTSTFNVVAGAADHVTFTNSTADLASGNTRTLTVAVRDAAGNLESGDNTTSVSFAKTSGTGTVSGLGTTTASGGVASQTVTGALAGPVTITVTANSLNADTATFSVVAGAAHHLTFASSTADLTSGTTRALTVEVRDAAGNLETGDNTTVITFAKTSGAGTVSGLGTATASGGVATKTVSGTLAGALTITAGAGSLSADTSTFTVVAGAADHLTFTSSTADLTSGTTRTLTTQVRDAAGNLETGDNTTVVTFAKTSGNGTVSGLGSATASAGVATKTVSGTLAGPITITASAGSLSTDTSTLSVVAGAADHLSFTSSTAGLASGTTRTLTAEVRDAAGNLETGDNTTSVTIVKTSGTGTVSGLGTATAAGGVASKSITGALAGGVTITASANALSSDATTFSVVAGAADHLTFTSSTADLASGTTRALTVEVRDAAGNLETGDNTTSVSFAKTSGTGTVSGLGTATAAAGVASKSITGTLAGPLTLSASAGSLGSDATTFTVVAGAADHLTFTSPTADLASGTTRALTVDVRDAAGNLETGDNTTSVSFAKTNGAGTITGLGTATASAGVATKTVSGALAGSITITASAGSLTADSTTLNVVAGAADHLTFTSSGTDLTSGVGRTLTVEVRDAAGNLETGNNTTSVSFAKTSGTGTVSGLGTATAAGGIATKTVTGALAGSITITASAGSLTDATTAFTIVPGAADHLSATSSTSDLASGNTRTLTVEVRDAAGNLESGDNTSVVTFTKTSGAGTVSGLGATTAAGGVATKTVSGALAGPVTITASASSLTADASTFNVVAGAADHLAFTSSTADLASGSTRTLTVAVRDAAGNLETGDTTVVTFAKTSGTGTVSGLGTTTAAGGIASKTVTGTLAGSLTITASAGSLIADATTFTAVAGAADHLTFASSTADLTSGVGRTLTVEVRDAAGNLESGDNTTSVNFAKTNGAGTVSGLGTTTAAGGVASKNIAGALAGVVTITASANALSSDATTFNVVAGAADHLTFTSSTADLASGNARTLTVAVRDAAGNLESGDNTTSVSFAKTSGTGTVSGLGTTTAAGGVATKTVTGTLAGPLTITASAGSLNADTSTFSVVAGAADHLTFTSSTADLTSGVGRTLTVEVRDAAGNLESGDNTTSVSFAKTSGTGTVSGLGSATAAGGIATKTVNGALAGPLTITASAGSLSSDSTTFSIVPGAADHLTFTSSTADLASGNTRTLTVAVRDAAGNLESGDNTTSVSFAKTSGTGTVSGLGTATAAGGVASKAVNGALAGPVTIAASASSLTADTSTFNVVPGTADHLSFTSSTANLASGNTRTLTVAVRDAAGNLETGDNTTVVAFTKTSGTGTVSGLGTATAGGGIATKTVSGTLAGSITITASASSLSADTSTFNVVAGAADHLTFTSSTADLASSVGRTLTVEIRDAAGNLESGDNTTTVSFAKTSGTGTVSSLGAATAAGGVATKTVNGALAGPVTITASASSLTADTSTFNVVPGAADHLTFTSSTADLASGNMRALTVAVRDAAGNLETGDNTTSVSFAKTSGTGTVSGLGTATVAGGVATKTVSGVLAGPLTITAGAASLSADTSTFNVVAGAADHLTFTSSTADLAAGTTRMLTAQVRDAAGNLETGDNTTVVTFAKTSGTGTVSGLGSATAAGGIATKTITGALAGPLTITASAGSLNPDTTTFSVTTSSVASGPVHLTFTSSTADLAAGATRTLTVQIRDAAGNLQTSDNTTVVTFAKANGAGTVTGLGTATAAGGIATKTVSGAVAGSITVTASATSVTSDTTTFTIVAGPPTHLTFTSSNADLLVGATRTLTVEVRDAFENLCTSDTRSITFIQTGGSGTVSGLPFPGAATGGIASRLVTGKTRGSVTITANSVGVTAGTSTFNVVSKTVVAAASPTFTGATQNVQPGTAGALTTSTGNEQIVWAPSTLPAGAKEIHADPAPVTGSVAGGFIVGGTALDVTLLTSSGSQIHSLPAPMEIVINSPTADVAPASSDDGATWHLLPMLPDRTLHIDQNDGYWLDTVAAISRTGKATTYRVHILTRHLTLFALVQDAKAPSAPTGLSGTISPDGLTLQWQRATDDGDTVASYGIVVDGNQAFWVPGTQTTARVAPFAPNDAHVYQVIAYDTSGTLSPMSSGITQVPNVIGRARSAATKIITQRGFTVGGATKQTGGHTAGAIVTAQTPATPAMAAVGSAVDLQVETRTGGAKLVTQILGARQIFVGGKPYIRARLRLTLPAHLTAYLGNLRHKRYARWTRDVGAGLHTLRLRLPASVHLRKGDRYWMEVHVQAGTQAVVRRTRIDF